MRQTEIVHDASQGGNDLGRRHLVVTGYRLEQFLGVFAPLPRRYAAGIDRLDAVCLGCPDLPSSDVARPFDLTRFQKVEQNLVIGHQDTTRFINDGRVAQLFVGMTGRENRHGGLVHGGPAHAGVEIAGDVGGRCRPADTAAMPLVANVGSIAAMVLRNHRPREVERSAGNVRMHVHAAGENHHAGCVDSATALDTGHDTAAGDADVADFAVDIVGGIVDFAALYA